MKRKTEIVSFRGDPSLLARIDKARHALELSRGDFVREITIAYFHQQEAVEEWPAHLADLRQALDEFGQALQRLSGNQKRSLFILLSNVGKLDPQHAKEIVKCQLRS